MTTETTTSAAPSLGAVQMLIGGEQVDAADGQTFDVVNPATGELLAKAPMGGPEDVNRAVAAAQDLGSRQPRWRVTLLGAATGDLRELRRAGVEVCDGAPIEVLSQRPGWATQVLLASGRFDRRIRSAIERTQPGITVTRLPRTST